MSLYKNHFRIESARLKSWDYRNSAWYFVTINTKNHNEYFGKVINSKVILNDVGTIAETLWLEIPKHYPSAELDMFVMMPNHNHGIIIINNVETGHAPSLPIKQPSLGNIIGSYKSAVSEWCNKKGILLEWQPRFFDRIIRNEKELYNIRKYIEQNPLKWDLEKNNPENIDLDIF